MDSPIFVFVRAVIGHWRVFVTGGVITGVLWLLQGIGYITPHWIYWTVAALGLLAACYRAWLDEHRRVITLTDQSKSRVAERKRELIRVLTALRNMEMKVLRWRDISNGRWGLQRDAEKLLPDSLPAILYEAGEIRPDLRTTMETVEKKAAEAESLIAQFVGQPSAFKQVQLMRQTYALLDEAVPLLSKVITEIEAFEKGLA